MSVGPLRRLVGFLGLLALGPTAAMLAVGRISPVDAAGRAMATLLVTVLVGRVAGWWVGQMARGYEQDLHASASGSAGPSGAGGGSGVAGRRAEDAVV